MDGDRPPVPAFDVSALGWSAATVAERVPFELRVGPLEDGRVGLFYLGLEIPHPEQPLRYFGRICR